MCFFLHERILPSGVESGDCSRQKAIRFTVREVAASTSVKVLLNIRAVSNVLECKPVSST